MEINKLTKNYLKANISGYLSKDSNENRYKGYLRLDLGENLLIRKHNIVSDFSLTDLIFYSDPSNENIKKIISANHNVLNENIVIANNTNEIIDYLPKMIIEKGNSVLIPVPNFFRFDEASLQAGAKIIYLNYPKSLSVNPIFIKKIISVVNKNTIKLLWLSNPNNPTGEIIKLSDIEKIVKNCKECFIVIDEAYIEFYDQKDKNSAINLIKKYKNLIVLRSLSKAYGCAGIRFGYGIAHKETILLIENYRNTLLMTSNIVIKLASDILKTNSFLIKTATETRKLKKELFSEINKLKNIKIGFDSKTNIYLLKHLKKDIYKELLKRKIVAADFRNSRGLEGLGYVRLTISNKKDNKKLLRTLKEIN